VVWIGLYLFMVWDVVPSNDAFVMFDDSVAVFLEGCVVVDVESVAVG